MTAVPEGFPKFDKQTRPWNCRIGRPDCSRSSKCPSCRGRANRDKGMRKQNASKKTMQRQMGSMAGRFSSVTGNEENWRLPVRVEVKAGKQVEPVRRFYEMCRGQSDVSKAEGDPRPFAAVAVPDGWSAGKFLYVVHSDEAEDFALAFVDGMTP